MKGVSEMKAVKAWAGAIGGLVVGAVIVALFCGVIPGVPPLFSSSSKSTDTQVIRAMEQTKEVSLLRLGITGVKSRENKSHFFNMEIPGTERAQFIQYSFDAKLGFDGKDVVIEPVGDNTFDVTIPEFKFIGYDHPEYRTIVEQNGALSFGTEQIDTANMINEILSDKAKGEYVDKNRDILEDQAKSFYTSIVKSVSPEAQLRFTFQQDGDTGGKDEDA